MTAPLPPITTPLLVVDDRADVLDALERYFSLDFERVYSATTPELAEEIFEREHPPLLLCDYWLGPSYPPATELLLKWRERYPFLVRVVLMSGTKASAIPFCAAVDLVVPKPLHLSSLVQYFRDATR